MESGQKDKHGHANMCTGKCFRSPGGFSAPNLKTQISSSGSWYSVLAFLTISLLVEAQRENEVGRGMLVT